MPSFFNMACLKAAVRDRQLWVNKRLLVENDSVPPRYKHASR